MEFWLKKLESNVIRDQQVNADLELLGWRVITVWECELRDMDQLIRKITAQLVR
jgi:DNA mismatch endonuclease (patch repair protein)